MARPKSRLSWGQMIEIWKLIVNIVLDMGGSDDDLARLLTDKDRVRRIGDIIVASNGKDSKPTTHDYATYQVSVDYTRTIDDMIAAGKYDWKNNDITEENFPIQRQPASVPAIEDGLYRTPPGVQNNGIKTVLVHLNKVVSTAEVLRHMDELGLQPARIEELLALGEQHSNLQLDFPLVALGSVWVRSGRDRAVPYLGSYGSERDLILRWGDPDGRWGEDCRFLAVSK